MKSQTLSRGNISSNYSNYLLSLLIPICSLLTCTCVYFDPGCELDSSAYNGEYKVNEVCNTNWGSSDYIITMTMDTDPNPSRFGCKWIIRNLFGKSNDVGAYYLDSNSNFDLSISESYDKDWDISGIISKHDNQITLDLTLINSNIDSTFTCTIIGTKI